jgi:2-polyprenyl-3-methyl-5-hydroxy-6-metoxy-1,4-benzoquinol methylase
MSDSKFRDVPIAAVEAFWDASPCNIHNSPHPLGSREYFDDLEQRKYFVEPHIPSFADFSRWKGKRVLEIGCGVGTTTISFARAGAHVTAVDLSAESVAVTRQRVKLFELDDRVDLRVGNAEELSSFVPVENYDLVYSFGVIHHSPRPDRIVGEARKYMGPQSELRLMVYSRVSYKLFWIMKQENIWDMSRIDQLVAKNSEAQSGCPVTYTYSADSVSALLKGFRILDISKAHIFTWDIPAYRRFEYKKDPAWAHVSDDELASLEKELGWHMLVRAVLSE